MKALTFQTGEAGKGWQLCSASKSTSPQSRPGQKPILLKSEKKFKNRQFGGETSEPAWYKTNITGHF